MVGSGKDIYASSMGGGGSSFGMETQCTICNGDWQNKYSNLLNDIYTWNVVAHYQTSNGIIRCSFGSYGLGANGDLTYMILLRSETSDQIGYIRISQDEKIEYYDSDGNVVIKYLGDYSKSGFGGESNGKFFGNWIYTFVDHPYEIDYCDGFDYIINCENLNVNEKRDKFNELARYLCGETTTIPGGVEMGKKPDMYDLEPPLDVKVTTVELDLFTNIPYKIWWSQSNIDLTGYNTVFYVKGYGEYKPSVFSAFKDIETSWMFEESFVTAKYCNNNLKYFDYSYEDMQRDLRAIAENVEGDSIYQVKNNSVDFMIRNEKEDENGQMHYSNWVYVNTYEDGTYSVFEMNTDYSIDEDSDETGQINTDSTIYDDEIVYEDNEETLDVGGVSNVGSFIKVMKDLANSLKTFPEFFAKMFSFLPSWVLTCIGILFIIILICAIF